MNTKAEYLLARYAEEEADWQMVATRTTVELLHGKPLAPKMLADIAAKRRIVELAEEATRDREAVISEFATSSDERAQLRAQDPGELILDALLSVYADRDDFPEEWR